MNIHRWFLPVCIFLLISAHTEAKEVPVNEAERVAMNFLKSDPGREYLSHDILETHTRFLNNIPVLYICNSAAGFVLVSADDRVYPVLGYSDEAPYSQERENDGFSWWIGQYMQQIHQVIVENMVATPDIREQWERYLTGKGSSNGAMAGVTPLMTTKWSQGNYYNALCPVASGGPGGRAMVGCVAVAMGQIMKCHAHPTQGTGSHSYTHSTYGTLSANFGTTTYNWSNMPNTLSGSNADVATLLYHAGVSVNMNYGPSASGATALAALNPLKQYFGYSASTEADFKSGYADAIWEKRLRLELDDGRPIFYGGVDASAGGHAFVCDGYNDNGFFHFNWGWGGYADGYFRVSNLNPAGNLFADNNYVILVRPTPFAAFCNGAKLLTTPTDTISDGSGKYFYQNKATCAWIIQPPGATVIYLHFLEFALESGYDFVKVYDGPNASSPLIGSYTGKMLPPPIVSSGGKLHVRFTSDDYVGDEGWKAVYSASATGIPEQERSGCQVSPNPSNGSFSILLGPGIMGDVQITVRNLAGQILHAEQVAKYQESEVHQVDLHSKPKGVCYLEVTSGSTRIIERVILQ